MIYYDLIVNTLILMAFVLLTVAFVMLTAAHHRIDRLEAKVKALWDEVDRE